MSQWSEAAMICVVAGFVAACSGGSGSSPAATVDTTPTTTVTSSNTTTNTTNTDQDGDTVQDSADLCPTVAGPVSNGGCPINANDADGDGTPNSSDQCPLVAGPSTNAGCPVTGNDADGDGIPDTTDHCGLQPGPVSNQGCPVSANDADGDDTLDSADKCLVVPGSVANDGCPVSPGDADGDGVPDTSDHCPYIPGPGTSDGCPLDTDNDGVPDDDDACDAIAGPVSNQGCPVSTTDSDGDTVPDSIDECPAQTGPASNNGCPLNSQQYRTPNDTIVTLTTDGSGHTSFVITVGSITYTGTYTTLNSGFDELRCTGTSQCRGYAIKIADNVIVFWWTDLNDPLKAVSLPTMAIVQGICPIQGANYNFVRLPSNTQKQAGWYPTNNGSGRDDMTVGGSDIAFNLRYVTFVPSFNGPALDDQYSCTNGIVHSAAGVSVSNSSSGLQIRDEGNGNGGSMGLLRPDQALAPASNPDFLQSHLGNRYFLGVQWNSTTGEVMALDGKYVSHGELTVVDTFTGNDNYQCKNTLGCVVSQVVNPATGVSRKTPFSRSFLSEFHDDNSPYVNYYGLFNITATHGTGAIAMNTVGHNGMYVLLEAVKGTAVGNQAGNAFNAVHLEYRKK
jgi:hypothetical protein